MAGEVTSRKTITIEPIWIVTSNQMAVSPVVVTVVVVGATDDPIPTIRPPITRIESRTEAITEWIELEELATWPTLSNNHHHHHHQWSTLMLQAKVTPAKPDHLFYIFFSESESKANEIKKLLKMNDDNARAQ